MVNLIRCKTKQNSVHASEPGAARTSWNSGRLLEAVGNDSSREMVIAPQGEQNPAYNCSFMKASALRRGLPQQGKAPPSLTPSFPKFSEPPLYAEAFPNKGRLRPP